jgi:hypothetical protein
MRNSWRPISFVSLSAMLAIVLSVPPAAASSITVFDFDDFPPYPSSNDDAVNTTLYGCRGKDFCTNADIVDARDNAISSISTLRNGIEGVFARPPLTHPAGVGVIGPYLNPGNVEDSGDYVPYVADFSKEMRFGRVDLALNSEGELGDYAFLEIWSGPDATGSLLGSVQESVAPDDWVTLALAAPSGSTFRSMRFGIGFNDPSCEFGCTEYAGGEGEQGFADNVGVQPIPEPTGVALFGAGTLVAGMAVRRRRVG